MLLSLVEDVGQGSERETTDAPVNSTPSRSDPRVLPGLQLDQDSIEVDNDEVTWYRQFREGRDDAVATLDRRHAKANAIDGFVFVGLVAVHRAFLHLACALICFNYLQRGCETPVSGRAAARRWANVAYI